MNAEQITYFLLTLIQLLMNFVMLAGVFGAVMKVRGAATKITEILTREPLILRKGSTPSTSHGDLELKNIEFCYPTKPDTKVLKGVNLQVKQGMVVALVGPSGGGKSSIVSIVERFYDPLFGSLNFDGTDVRDLHPSWYHRQVSLVQQEPVLFSGTIRDNIAYGVTDVSEEDIVSAAKMANAFDFITDADKFPQGFDTVVGERGILLSGGQKQRVAIARALVRKPKVLVLDEATSALDAESERLVQKALDNLIAQGQQTVIVIAHRLSTVKDADLIVVVKGGEIVEAGTHRELLAK